MKNSRRTIAITATCVLTLAIVGAARQPVRLNENSFSCAKELIAQGRISLDLRNAWSESQPSAKEENEFIRNHGIDEYAKWHLGIDESHGPQAKVRYKFPYGDFKTIHRSALLAIKNRARQHGYAEIENAAVRLLEMIEAKGENHVSGRQSSDSHDVRKFAISSGNSSL